MIEFQNVVMNFGDKQVLKDVSFTAKKGEIFTFIGPSGSGKTTILRIIDILERPTNGRVLFDGTDVNMVGKKDRVAFRRRMSMVFQKPASLRGNVYENIAMGLKFRDIPAGEIEQRVPEALKLVGLGGYESRKAEILSGGEMQRVALARAIATKPDVLLLDEPTANIDPVSTERIEKLILSLNRHFNRTVILSTHDMIQGQRLADRIAVVIEGRIEQVGMSKEIFYHPLNSSVAHLAGVENIFDGRISSNEEGLATVMVDGIPISAVTPLPPEPRLPSSCGRALFIIRGSRLSLWQTALIVGLVLSVPQNIGHLLPNPMIPLNSVRISHMIETASSTFVFGVIVTWLLYPKYVFKKS